MWAHSISRLILLYVEDHPGSTRNEIIDGLDIETKPTIVSTTLTRLRREGYLRKEGGTSNARWWITDLVPVIGDYRRSTEDVVNFLVKQTGCTSNAARTALHICESSADYEKMKRAA